MKTTRLIWLLVLAMACTNLQPQEVAASKQQALVKAFAAGSLIIPMDNTHQNNGMLKAYGLVIALLKAGVPVHWAISPTKADQGSDFTATAVDHQSAAAITAYAYRGGPFVIDAADRTAALTVIDAWQMANPAVKVHDAQAFSADIKTTLYAAPRIAVFLDSNEIIAFRMLNAAGIPDSTGSMWPTAAAGSYPMEPDVLTEAQIRGTSTGGAADGALRRTNGTPAWHFLASMHWDSPSSEVVREVKLWLQDTALSHGYMQCTGASAFENNANGNYLTTGGIAQEVDCVLVLCADRAAPNPPINRVPSDELMQYDGAITVDDGDLQSIRLQTGSALRPNTNVLLSGLATGTTRMAMLKGPIGGDATKGLVSYLAGHDYSTTLPMSTNPLTNGARIFLNAVLASGVSQQAGQPNLAFTQTGPALTSASTITWTFSYANTGLGVAEAAKLTDVLPAGATFLSASNGGTASAGTVTWNLGDLAPGAMGTVTVTVDITADGTYANTGKLSWMVGLSPGSKNSNTVSSVRDATSPHTTITQSPTNPSGMSTATVAFSSTDTTATFKCSLDGAPFATCTSPVALTGLADGSHTFSVFGTDLAGNPEAVPASVTWVVDTVAPAAPTVSQPAAGSIVSTQRPLFSGLAEAGASVAIRVDGGLLATVTADAAGGWSYTPTAAQALSVGMHSVTAQATDAAGNTGPMSVSNTFTIDLLAPPTPVITSPLNGTSLSTGMPTVTGTAPAGSTVRVFADGVLVGTVIANGAGVFAYTLTAAQALAAGSHALSAAVFFVVQGGPAVVNVTIDLTAPVAPVVVSPVNGASVNTANVVLTGTAEAGTTVNVIIDGATVGTALVDGAGMWTFTTAALTQAMHTASASATDAAGNTGPASTPVVSFTVDTTAPMAPVVTTPVANSTTSNPRPVVTGTAEANAKVEIFIDGTLVGSTTADGTGAFTFTPSADIADGQHLLTARAVDAAGNHSPESMDRAFRIDRVAPTAPVIVTPGNGTLVTTATPKITGTATPGSTVTVTIDGMVAGTAVADASGNWSLQTAALSEGEHTVKAKATNGAGNSGPDSTASTFTVDTMAPGAPAISTPVEGAAVSNMPTITGTAAPGSVINILFNGVQEGTAIADASGNWSFTSSNGAPNGTLVITATATDAAGNTSAPSAPRTITIGMSGGSDGGTTDGGMTDGGVTPGVEYTGGGCGCASEGGGTTPLVLLVFLALIRFARVPARVSRQG